MNRCGYQQQQQMTSMEACGGEMRMIGGPSPSDSVLCPKPRRIAQSRPSRCHQTEISDSKAGMDLLDIILSKGSYGAEKFNNQVASSPPYFCGSPPSRASNPLIQDSQFGNDKFSQLLQAPVPAISPSSSAARKGGGSCARVKFGHKPADVRVEGFDCLSRDRRSVSAMA